MIKKIYKKTATAAAVQWTAAAKLYPTGHIERGRQRQRQQIHLPVSCHTHFFFFPSLFFVVFEMRKMPAILSSTCFCFQSAPFLFFLFFSLSVCGACVLFLYSGLFLFFLLSLYCPSANEWQHSQIVIFCLSCRRCFLCRRRRLSCRCCCWCCCCFHFLSKS